MKMLKILKNTLNSIHSIDKLDFYLIIILSVISGITPIVSLKFTQAIFNELQEGQQSFKYFVIVISFYALFLIVTAVLSNNLSFFSNRLSIKTRYTMTEQLMQKCSKLSLEELEDADTYEKINRIENEIKSKPMEVLNAVLQMLSSIVVLFGSIGILLSWKPILSIFFLLYSIVQIILNLKIAHQEFNMMYERSEKERKVWYYTFLLTHDTGFKEIKTLSLARYFIKKYSSLSNTFIKNETSLSRKRLNLNTLLTVIQETFSGLIMVYAIFEAYQKNILIGTAIIIISTLGIIYSSITGISNQLYTLYNSSLYMEQWIEFTKESLTKVNQLSKKCITKIEDISFSDVHYHYKNENSFSIQNINFDVHKGQRVAVVGKNGSGKSTFLKLLVGLYKPKKGVIKINGEDLNSINLESYYKLLSILFQDFLKYEDTVLENVVISDINNPIELIKVMEALEKANFSLEKTNKGILDVQLGNWFSEGQQLSGGEWQKMALARTYYKDSDVLVLDEPSSALDSVAERQIFNTFFELTKNKIGVFITHKVSIAKKSDIIVVMNDGKIDAIGEHDQLMRNCKIYAELHNLEQNIS